MNAFESFTSLVCHAISAFASLINRLSSSFFLSCPLQLRLLTSNSVCPTTLAGCCLKSRTVGTLRCPVDGSQRGTRGKSALTCRIEDSSLRGRIPSDKFNCSNQIDVRITTLRSRDAFEPNLPNYVQFLLSCRHIC